jgi:hypothetical protein
MPAVVFVLTRPVAHYIITSERTLESYHNTSAEIKAIRMRTSPGSGTAYFYTRTKILPCAKT